MTTQTSDQIAFNSAEAAQFLRLSHYTFRKGVQSGNIPNGFQATPRGHCRWHRHTLESLLLKPAA